MKAVVCTKYGPPDVLQLREVEKPTIRDDEVLIKIHVATVTSGDTRIRSLNVPFGFRFPMRMALGFRKPRKKILGIELAGEIESVGKKVERFKVGDKVFASTGFGFGCYAEYVSVPEDKAVALKPVNMTYEQAAAVPVGAATALFFLRKGKIESGQKVLIYGASGSIGTFAVQLAKHFGAEVTGVCSTTNLELVESVGADHVIDYTREDFATNGETYDVIFDTVGKSLFSSGKQSLKKRGRYLLAEAGLSKMMSRKVITGLAPDKKQDLIFLKGLIEDGKLTSVIDRRYPLEQIAEAHAYVDKGHKKGNVIITVDSD